VGVSLGTAVVLRLLQAPQQVAPTTAYLTVGDRCLHDCGFCAQARGSAAGETRLSRITWPRFPTNQVLEALARERSVLRRVCIQATAAPGAQAATLALVKALRAPVRLPIDASILPESISAADELIAAGVDHIGFGLDAATATVFERVKGGSPVRYTRLIESLATRAPGRAAVHLIAGLGETELEMAAAFQRYHDLGATVGLFAFCPVPGTRMAGAAPPPVASYRRLQIVRWLIAQDAARAADLEYGPEGSIAGLGSALAAALLSGEPFRTSGCPGCNRPYYNERPSGPMYNYPRPLTAPEVSEALSESALAELALAPVAGRG
jgi:lipoyl synthase